MNMDHADVREALLAAVFTPAVSAHLEHCPDCASLGLGLQAIDELAPSMETKLALPPGLIENTLARIAENHDAMTSYVDHAGVREALVAAETNPRAIDELAPSMKTEPALAAGLTARAAVAGFLAALAPPETEDLRARGRRRHFARGSAIVNEGEVPRRVIVLLSGRVKVSDFSADGREIVLGARGPGDLIGEISAIDGQPCSSTVTAIEPVEAMVVDAVKFTAFLDAHPRVLRVLLKSVVQKLRDSDRKRVEFSVHDTEGRVARRLVELADEHGEEQQGMVSITLTQHELAGWTSSSREAVSKALGNLRGCGWVETDRRRVTITNLEALRRRAGL